MKKILLIILFIFLTIPCLGEQTLFLNKTWDKNASKILYEYILNEHKMSPEKAYDAFGYKLSDVRAIFYDLNADGIDEILGYIDVPSSYSADGAYFEILSKQANKYIWISLFNAYPHLGIKILDSKTDSYKDIVVYTTKQWKQTLIKFNKKQGYYEYFF